MSKNNSLSSNDSVQIHNIGKGSYTLPVTPNTKFIVDDSCFIPMSEAVKQLGLNPNYTGSENKTMYDFVDGKDNGMEMPLNRTKDGIDIAELSSEISKQQENIANEIKKAQEFQAFKQQKQDELDKLRPATLQKSV